jgi:prepilin-type N-terminal cleavage/methylation domain-containing protein
MRSKGFTLIELLVVVAIIAILAIVVVLTINPTELLRQSRDTSRVSDMSTLNKAVSLYYQDAMNNPSTLFMGTSSVIYVSIPDTTTATSTAGDQCQGLGLPSLPTNFTYHCAASSTYTMTNGTGWIPINFNAYVSSVAGSVISKLSVDPVNTTSTNLYYTYQTDGIGGFKVAAFFESQKDASLMASDGGNDAELYEKGSNLALASGRGLVGYWPMDEGVGTTAIDQSENGNLGTWSGTQAGTSGYYSLGKVGPWTGMFNGINTVGTGNFIGTASPVTTATTNITLAAWFKTSNANRDGQGIVYNGSDKNGNGYGFFVNMEGETDGHLKLLYGAIAWYDTGVVVSSNAWHYGVMELSNNGKTMTFYLDGSSVYTNTVGTAPNAPTLETDIGRNNYIVSNPGVDRYFLGLIDDVRVYNRALSAGEIQEMYNAEK